MKYMLDTNVFNAILRENISTDTFKKREILVTHVQQDELHSTTDKTRREELRAIFLDVHSISVLTDTMIWDNSRWDECNWSSTDGLYDNLLSDLKEADRKKGKRTKGFNQSRDARIAETAIHQKATLVTDDEPLAEVARAYGCPTLATQDFFKLLTSQ